MAKKTASKGKSKASSTIKKARKKLPKSKGRFYEDPQLVRSRRDPNYK